MDYNKGMNEETLRKNISQKITFYRKAAGLTQLELAEKLNYSDKSVSKWERGDGLPDITVLSNMAELFGISVDDFISSAAPKKPIKLTKKHTLVPALSVGLVWLTVTFIYFVLAVAAPDLSRKWLVFIYGCPVSFIVTTVFSCLWWKTLYRILSISGIIWTLAACVDITLSIPNIYLIYAVAAVFQILVFLWFWLMSDRRKTGK